MNVAITYGAVLLLGLLALALPALAFKQHRTLLRKIGLDLDIAHFIASEAGYTTVYCWPGGASGQSTTAPTAAQASAVTLQTALIAMGDAETFAQFTHNWGLPASFPSFLFPLIFYRQSDIGVGPSTQLAALTFAIANTNVVTVLKVAGLGNGGSFIVTLMRPHSLVR